jgi:iron complex outermembrane recepter protein
MYRHVWMAGASSFALAVSLCLPRIPAHADPAVQLPTVDVNAPAGSSSTQPQPAPAPAAAPADTPPVVQRYQLPQKSDSITSKQIEETINLRDPEDAIKYFPSLFVRKRNDGDNQAVLATRTWGLSSSARTLIFADDILISALINNNNQNGSPHWNLIPPDSIERIDFLEGPFAAAYSGNSEGGVLLITTKMPDKLTVSAKQTESIQPFNQYGTNQTFVTHQTSASIGDRSGLFSWFFNANFLDSYAQPLTYTTSPTIPAGTTGAFPALNKLGAPANVVGTGAVTHSEQFAANLRLAMDFTPWLQGRYTLGFWSNDQTSTPSTYLTSTASGGPTFASISGFATNNYTWLEQHLANAVSLRSDTHGPIDFDFAASTYNYLTDIQRNPFTVSATGVGFSEIGKIARMDGTNWQNIDLKGIWRPFGFGGPNEVSFGLHGDRYYLDNPTYQTATFNAGSGFGDGALYSSGKGQTETGAIWAQDAWRITPAVKLTVGGRLEDWAATDGFNLTTTTSSALSGPSVGAITGTKAVNQPSEHATDFSPKASLSWTPAANWDVTGSFGEAYRYPTVGELYQLVTSGSTFVTPNPNLSPEQDLATEVDIERRWDDGKVRLSLFEENVHNTLISQTNFVNVGTSQFAVTSVSNVARTRNRGAELSSQQDNVFIKGLEMFGSVTYVDARILSDPTFAGTSPTDTANGKRVPNVPDWRATLGFTYRPDTHWAFTAAARYSGKQYSTLDNTDNTSNVFGAFDRFFVVDTRIHYDATENLSFDFGIDNINNDKYFLFHPFPGRTFVADARIKF